MDIQLEKYKLVKWLINLRDEDVINEIKKIKETTAPDSAREEISENEKALIAAGLKNIYEGETHSHENVLRELKEKYNL